MFRRKKDGRAIGNKIMPASQNKQRGSHLTGSISVNLKLASVT